MKSYFDDLKEDPGPPFGAPVIVEPRDLPLRPTHSPPHGLTHRDAPGSRGGLLLKKLVSLWSHLFITRAIAGEAPSAAARLPCGSLLFVNEINIC